MPRKRLFMNIAVVADGKSIESMVSEEFVLCNYLLIVNMDNMEFDTLENKGDLYGETLANIIVENDCEAVITGKLTKQAFDIIADNNVTRYDGRGYSVGEALVLMNRYALRLIRNIEGTDYCLN
ncbi:MAG TPA: NifB/NifX family molybdenum-iron cluster-binding protein [Bacillota bacterium]|nr:NifB/NifX family molybdenum-iron cluster-binding protein [Bacillota bacterium]